MQTKLTKIIATLSDHNSSVESIRALYEAGMNIVRINTAHQDMSKMCEMIDNIKAVSEKIPILLDTKGPEIRTVQGDEAINLETGQKVKIKGDSRGISTNEILYLSYGDIVGELQEGSTILIDDGAIELYVEGKSDHTLECVVKQGGVITGRKSINIPDFKNSLPSINTRDREFIDFAIEHDITFIAHSFVRDKEDLIHLQQVLDEKKSNIKIVAKIENHQGVENLHEILHHCHGVMVARGDLGVELPPEKIPVIQREIIKKCHQHRKPVIIATQMLHSMIEYPRPTRAEVNDVASAVYSDADCVMLSGETAYGKYPLKSVQMMSRICEEAESQKKHFSQEFLDSIEKYDVPSFLAKAAVVATKDLPVRAIVFDTMTGRTAAALSSCRAKVPLYAMAYSKRVMKELALHYGVYANYIDKEHETDSFVCRALGMLTGHCIQLHDYVAVVAGNFGESQTASFVEIDTADNLMKHKERTVTLRENNQST